MAVVASLPPSLQASPVSAALCISPSTGLCRILHHLCVAVMLAAGIPSVAGDARLTESWLTAPQSWLTAPHGRRRRRRTNTRAHMDRSAEKPLMEEPSYDELLPREGSCTRHWIFPTGRKVVAEMLGTFFLMMSACGSIMAGWDIMGQALAVAFSLIMIISSLGHVSGAHLNPAISVAFAATKLFPWWQVPWYFGGQLAGGISAMLLAKLLYNAGNGAALTKPASDGWAQAFGMEVVLTFGLSFLATAMNILPNFMQVINKAERKHRQIRQTQHELDEEIECMKAREDFDQQIRNIKKAARSKIQAEEEEDNKLKLKDKMLVEHIKCISAAQSFIK